MYVGRATSGPCTATVADLLIHVHPCYQFPDHICSDFKLAILGMRRSLAKQDKHIEKLILLNAFVTVFLVYLMFTQDYWTFPVF
jgi:hypothetical protein